MAKVIPEHAKGKAKGRDKEDLPVEEQAVVDEVDERVETPEQEKAKELFLEASKLVLRVPAWVHAQHELFYKVAYLTIREDEKASRQPARIRQVLIKQLMNKMIVKMGKFYEEQKKEKQEKEENAKREF